MDGHTVNRTEAAAVATSHTATVMSRAAAARGCSRYVTAAIVRAEDSTVPTGNSSALLSWYGCHKQGRLQLVLRKYSFFVFFSSLLRTFCWSPLANAFKMISRGASGYKGHNINCQAASIITQSSKNICLVCFCSFISLNR